jgi:glycerol-3-phosphate acyltransferase PlsX
MEKRATVALDGFGAEQGFDAVAEGARMAAADGIVVRVFGPAAQLELSDADGVEVSDTSDSISNADDPIASVRGRRDASVVRAAAVVAAGEADAMVSHGSTGAAMAAATFGLKRMRGVQRPALAARLPVPGAPVLFLDVGANTEVRSQHLVQFAYLGAAFSRAVLGVADPRVGLLSVGEEEGKGTPAVAEANERLRGASGLRFVGNIEGRDLPAGVADVVVTDGFTGNVSLKLMEGTAKAVTGAIRGAARSNPLAAAGGLMMRPALAGLRRELQPDSTGGAILLGLRRIAVVGHGSAGPEGIANAIRLAARCVEEEAVERTEQLLRESGATRADLADSEPGASA